jgi:hypothetical protein
MHMYSRAREGQELGWLWTALSMEEELPTRGSSGTQWTRMVVLVDVCGRMVLQARDMMYQGDQVMGPASGVATPQGAEAVAYLVQSMTVLNTPNQGQLHRVERSKGKQPGPSEWSFASYLRRRPINPDIQRPAMTTDVAIAHLAEARFGFLATTPLPTTPRRPKDLGFGASSELPCHLECAGAVDLA